MTALSKGVKIGGFQIERLIATGGAAEVYQVQDLQAGGPAALKLITEKEGSEDRRRRFAEEARVYSRLIHPRIVRLIDAGEFEGRPYIVTEWVDGITLGEKIGLGHMTARQALEVMLQVADGLSAAHAQGLIHRDLKPTNIMLTEKGEVKLLDFGLAKTIQPGPLASRSWTTVDGTILGTPAYMSPEQTRGEPLTLASDVFSFGVLLYEVLTGHSPFQKGTVAETLGAVLKEDPPDLPSLADFPSAEISRLIEKCLQKNPERRPADSREIFVDLRRILAGERTLPKRRGGWTGWKIAGVLGGVVLVSALVFFSVHAWTSWRRPQPPLVGLRPVPVVGNSPCLSPDGREVVFRSEEGREIWAAPLGEGNPQLVLGAKGFVGNISVTADGKTVFFDAEGSDGARWIQEVPMTGGSPRKVMRGWNPAVTKDGRIVAGLARLPGGEYEIILCRRDGTERKALSRLPNGLTPVGLCFDHRGEGLFVSMTDGLRHSEIERVSLADGGVRKVAQVPGVAAEGLASIADGTGVLWSVQIESDGTNLLGISSLDDGEFHLLLPGPARTTHPSLALEGNLLAVQIREARNELIEVTVDPRATAPATDFKVLPHTEEGTQPRVSPDGKRIVFRSGRKDLWILDRDSGSAGPLLATGESAFNPAWSSSGNLLAYSSLRDDQADLWIAAADGTDPRRLTSDAANDVHAVWHPDGRHLFFISDKEGSDELYRLDVGTGQVVRVGHEGALNPAISPDGRYLAYIVPAGEHQTRLRLSRLGPDLSLGETVWERSAASNGWAGNKPRFSPDSRWVAFDAPVDPVGADIWALPVDAVEDTEPVRLTMLPFTASTLSWFDWTKDGKLVITATRAVHRVMLLPEARRWFDRALQ